jgi:hypothetical protein
MLAAAQTTPPHQPLFDQAVAQRGWSSPVAGLPAQTLLFSGVAALLHGGGRVWKPSSPGRRIEIREQFQQEIIR